MDLRQLRYFVQVVETGSLSRAADVLHLAQPSLSAQIKKLEEEHAVQLLNRSFKGVIPTDKGKLLYDYAQRILKEAARAGDMLRSPNAEPIGKITVGIPTSACRGLSYNLITASKQELPGVSLHIVEAMTAGLDEWIETGKLDVALLYDHKAFENVAWTEMLIEELMLIAPLQSDLSTRRKISLRELEGLVLVLPGQSNVLRQVMERHFAVQDMKLNVGLDCDSLPAIAQLVRSGYHTILPHFAFASEITRGEMIAIPVVDPTPSWKLSVVLSKRTLNASGSEAVALVMAKTIRSMVQTGEWRARQAQAGPRRNPGIQR